MSANTATITPSPPARRLLSLDALRGFDMFWIIGGDAIFRSLYKAWPCAPFRLLDGQVRHKAWAGITFYDVIFPLFIFIVGVSLVFSLGRSLERDGMARTIRKIFFRSVILYGFGLLVYGGLSQGIDHVRWVGVLQRIALCYLATGLLFCCLRLKPLMAICAVLLLGYWALTAYLPIRNFNLQTAQLKALGLTSESSETKARFLATSEFVRSRFEDGLSVPQHFDFQYLPGFKWDGAYDPEGLLGTLPAIATCLLGVFAGLLLKNDKVTDQRKVSYFLIAGLAGIFVGFLWGLTFPVIKQLWTSSYVLVAGGFSCLLLAAFFQMIEIWNWRKWCTPFVWIGMNPITIYLIYEILPLKPLARRIVGGPVEHALGRGGDLLVALVVTAAMLALVRFLYVKKIFLRL